MAKILYIIGNGFDLHHGLDTRYQSFAKYLSENNSDVYDLLMNYYPLSDINKKSLTDEEYGLWSRFEDALADLNYEAVLDDNEDLAANIAAEDFRDSDWHTYQIEMEEIIKDLTTTLIGEFNKFILDVDYSHVSLSNLIKIEESSHFLNFNYTETLEEIYHIHDDRITFIHNKATENECKLILGHGTDPKQFIPEEISRPEGLSDEEYYEWREQMADSFEFSYESAKQEILTYYTKAFKNTSEIIESNIGFFLNLTDIEKIIVLGHSLSNVDKKYFEKVKDHINENVIWHVSYFSDVEKKAHMETLLQLGIESAKIVQMKISDLAINHS